MRDELTALDPAQTPARGLQRIRLSVLILAALICVGTALELFTLKHWNGFDQLIPWIIIAGTLLVTVLYATVRTPVTTWLARGWALLAAGGSAFGMKEHLEGNMEVGELDPVLGDTWSSLSTAQQLWHAFSGDVGPTPVLAAGFACIGALCLFVATVADPWRLPRR